jgi:hypothetical protein
MEGFNQDAQYQEEFLWLERENGRSPNKSKVEHELSKRVERLERKLEGVERKLKRSEDTF